MKRPEFSAITGLLKSKVLSVRKSFRLSKRQLVILGGSLGFVLILAVGSALLGMALSQGRRASVVDPDMALGYSLEGARVLRGLYMPGPAVGQTSFPLAFEPDPGYTDGIALKVHNDMSGIDASELTARRKAELEAIYEALD